MITSTAGSPARRARKLSLINRLRRLRSTARGTWRLATIRPRRGWPTSLAPWRSNNAVLPSRRPRPRTRRYWAALRSRTPGGNARAPGADKRSAQGETLAALGAPGAQYLAPADRAAAHQESVRAGAFDPARLVGAFHGCIRSAAKKGPQRVGGPGCVGQAGRLRTDAASAGPLIGAAV